MSITAEARKDLIKDNARSDNDSGSVEVQCALLTARINNLTNHFENHKKDFSSRRGLLLLVNSRRKLLDYLKSESEERYKALITKLDIRK